MQEIKNKIHTTQESIQEIKNNSQVYTTKRV